MKIIKREDYSRGKFSDGSFTATMKCPGCNRTMSLSDHKIGNDGKVSPSVVCGYDCGFHEHIRLERWISKKDG